MSLELTPSNIEMPVSLDSATNLKGRNNFFKFEERLKRAQKDSDFQAYKFIILKKYLASQVRNGPNGTIGDLNSRKTLDELDSFSKANRIPIKIDLDLEALRKYEIEFQKEPVDAEFYRTGDRHLGDSQKLISN